MRNFCIALLLFAVSPASIAQSQDPLCDSTTEIPPARFLPDLRSSAEQVRVTYCSQAGQDAVTSEFKVMINGNLGWFDPFGSFQFDQDPLKEILAGLQSNPTFSVPSISITIDDELQIGARFFTPNSTDQCESAARGAACGEVLDEFKAIYTAAHKYYAAPPRQAFRETIIEYQGEWKEFLDATRGFTLLEAIVNAAIFKRSEPTHFSRPPDRQYILLHPNVSMEHVDGADNGDSTNEAFAIDVVGVNWWRQSRWYVPSGGAFSVVYSDRQSTDNWGYGISAYFAGKYTLGVSRRDGDTGVYVSLDLLKLFQDNASIVDRFSNAIR